MTVPVPIQLPEGRVIITRKARFSSAHYLALDEWDDQQNFNAFWKASGKPGHGHNYAVEVGVEGTVDPATGMVMNLTDLKAMLLEEAIEPFDFKHLNDDPAFAYKLPAIENICTVLWQCLKPRIATPTMALRWIAVSETDSIWGSILGTNDDNETDCMTDTHHFFTKTTQFCAGHRLHNPAFSDDDNASIFGKCNNPNGHGHNYQLDVTVTGPQDDRTGLIVDLGKLETAVESVVAKVDHLNLNTDVDFLTGVIPTAENIARGLWGQLAPLIPAPASLHRIRLVETYNNAVEYYGPQHGQANDVMGVQPVAMAPR